MLPQYTSAMSDVSNKQKLTYKKLIFMWNSTKKSSHDKLFSLTFCPFQYGVAFAARTLFTAPRK